MAATLEQFVQAIADSGILSSADVAAFVDGDGPASGKPRDPQELAKELVKAGKLTRYQAQAIYSGKGKGLAFGEYVVLDKIGAGGMGQVYKAQHRRMKRVVALKLLPPEATRSPQAVRRFYQEVEMAARLTHPNIVTAYDAGEANGLHYLVMEYVNGKDLATVVRESGSLSVAAAVDCITQAARGLEYAHRQGVVHRDIKPSNLLQDAQGVVKILDMGLARIENTAADAAAEEGVTQSGQILGTVDFMAPEQAQDTRHADQRADLYSLGCTLYRLLTGKNPFEADTLVRKLLAHRDQPIPSLRAARHDVPHKLDEIFRKLLAKKPEERFQTATELLAALQTVPLIGVGEDHSPAVTDDAPVHDESLGSFLKTMSGSSTSGVARAAAGASAIRKASPAKPPSSSGSHGSLTLPPPAGGAAAEPAAPAEAKRLPWWIPAAGAGGLAVVALVVVMVFVAGGGSEEPDPSPANPATTAVATADPTGSAALPAATVATASPTATPAATAQPAAPSPKQATERLPADLPTALKPFNLLDVVHMADELTLGEWLQTSSGLISPASGRARVPLAVNVPDEYLLELDVVREGKLDACVVVLPIGDRRVVALVDGYVPAVAGLSNVSDLPAAANSTTTRGPILADHAVNHLAFLVRGGAIEFHAGSRRVFRWEGNLEDLSLPEAWEAGTGRQIVLGSYNTSYRFTKAVLHPLSPGWSPQSATAASASPSGPTTTTGGSPTTAPPGVPVIDKPTDALALVNPERDTRQPTWSLVDGALVSSVEGDALLAVPALLPPAYRLTAVVERRSGNGPLVLGLAMTGAAVGLVIDGQDDHSGPEQVDGAGLTAHGWGPSGRQLVEGKPVEIVCEVLPDRLRVVADGREWFDWYGEGSRMRSGLTPRPSDKGKPFLWTHEAGIAIKKLEIAPLDRIDGPPLAGAPVDLVALADAGRDAVGSQWLATGTSLAAAPQEANPAIQSAVAVPREYRMSLVIQYLTGTGGLYLGLPMESRNGVVVLDYQDRSRIELNGNPAAESGYQGNLLQYLPPVMVECDVNRKGVAATVNGQPAIRWEGSVSQLYSPPDLPAKTRQHALLMLNTWGSSCRIDRWHVRALDWKRLPPPAVAELTTARTQMRDTHRAALTNLNTPDKQAAAALTLLRRACQTLDSPPLRYAYLEEAHRLAVQSGDLASAWNVATLWSETFELDPIELYTRTLADIIKPTRSPAVRRELVLTALRLCDLEVAAERFQAASLVNRFAATNVTKIQSPELLYETKLRDTELKDWTRAWEAAQSAREDLRADADDASAHLALGRYLCLVRGNWTEGLDHLARSGDPLWQAAAELERSRGADPKAAAAIADAWMAVGDKAELWAKVPAYDRAAELYRAALGTATAGERSRIETRLTKRADTLKTAGSAFGTRHPLDAVRIGSHWYKLFQQPINWHDAVRACEQAGGYLACLESAQENQAVEQYALAAGSRQGQEVNYWLGLSDEVDEGVYRWVNGAPFSFQDFAPGSSQAPIAQYVFASQEGAGGKVVYWHETGPKYNPWFMCEWDR